MSGYTQNPPPLVQVAWWNPPDKLIAHLSLSALMDAKIVPYVANIIGFNTLQRNSGLGIKHKGISIHEHIAIE